MHVYMCMCECARVCRCMCVGVVCYCAQVCVRACVGVYTLVYACIVCDCVSVSLRVSPCVLQLEHISKFQGNELMLFCSPLVPFIPASPEVAKRVLRKQWQSS